MLLMSSRTYIASDVIADDGERYYAADIADIT